MDTIALAEIFTLSKPFPRSYWVLPGRFLAGEYPGSALLHEAYEKTRSLLNLDINTFIDLTMDDHLDPYEPILRREAFRQQKTYRYIKYGFRDMSTPSRRDMKNILNAIDAEIELDHNLYVHCWGGIGRTGTVVGCFLARHGITGQAALDEIGRLRLAVPGSRESPETDEQRRMVLNWGAGQ